MTAQVTNIYLPAMDQRNLGDLELIFQPVRTPLLTQYTCPGPPQASQQSEQHSCRERSMEKKDVTEIKVIHKKTPLAFISPPNWNFLLTYKKAFHFSHRKNKGFNLDFLYAATEVINYGLLKDRLLLFSTLAIKTITAIVHITFLHKKCKASMCEMKTV